MQLLFVQCYSLFLNLFQRAEFLRSCKHTVTRLVSKVFAICGTPKFITLLTRALLHALALYLFETHSSVILLYKPRRHIGKPYVGPDIFFSHFLIPSVCVLSSVRKAKYYARTSNKLNCSSVVCIFRSLGS
jgi:hypothetical protein